jgi:hypothetical protein
MPTCEALNLNKKKKSFKNVKNVSRRGKKNYWHVSESWRNE